MTGSSTETDNTVRTAHQGVLKFGFIRSKGRLLVRFQRIHAENSASIVYRGPAVAPLPRGNEVSPSSQIQIKSPQPNHILCHQGLAQTGLAFCFWVHNPTVGRRGKWVLFYTNLRCRGIAAT
jgi:hypothetical protein